MYPWSLDSEGVAGRRDGAVCPAAGRSRDLGAEAEGTIRMPFKNNSNLILRLIV